MRTRLHRLSAPLFPAILALAFIVPAGAQEPSPVKPPVPNPSSNPNVPSSEAVVLGVDEGPLVIPGDAPDLILEFTGKVLGYVEPCG
jgi:hypothetical protein